MTANDKVKFAVMGYGYIGKRHAEMIRQQPQCELVAVIDVKKNEQIIDVPFFKSVTELVNSGVEVDVINIATPNGYHTQHALEALDHKKHIVVEKPLALKKSDALKIMNKASEMNRHVFVVMQNRYSPVSKWLKDVVQSGILGKIFMVQVNCFWNRGEQYYNNSDWHGKKDLDGGTLFTQFSHFIDLIYWIFGDITNISSKFWNGNHQTFTEFEDSGNVSFDFVNGGAGGFNFTTSVWDKNLESSVTILAENGTIKVGGQYMNNAEYCHIKNYEMPDLHKVYDEENCGMPNHYYVFRDVADTLKNGTPVKPNAEEAMKVVDIIERMYAAKERK